MPKSCLNISTSTVARPPPVQLQSKTVSLKVVTEAGENVRKVNESEVSMAPVAQSSTDDADITREVKVDVDMECVRSARAIHDIRTNGSKAEVFTNGVRARV